MTMQTDVLASSPRNTSGVMQTILGSKTVGRCRIKAVIFNTLTDAGLTLYNGASTSGTQVLNMYGYGTTYNYQLLPGEGILCPDGVYIAITGVATCVVIYG